jgi:phospholipid/cholesterol/gamma-HCH transport system substrate-binding protein
MSDRRNQVQVGILFIASVIILVAGILWFKEYTIGGQTYNLIAEFESTSGLIKGDPVEVKGVSSGKVAEIRFEGGLALVTLQLNRSVELHHGTTVAIENAGLMGQKVVAIYPGPQDGVLLGDGAVIHGDYRGGITELLGGVGGALNTFETLAGRIDSLLVSFDASRQDQLDRTLTNLERATGELATLLEDNRDDLGQGIKDLAAAMAEVRSMVDGRGEQFGEALDSASGAMARFDSTLTGLDTTVARMDSLLAKVESGKGTLGRVIQDDGLYYEMVVTLRDAKALLKDLRENPKRYFKVSIF